MTLAMVFLAIVVGICAPVAVALVIATVVDHATDGRHS